MENRDLSPIELRPVVGDVALRKVTVPSIGTKDYESSGAEAGVLGPRGLQATTRTARGSKMAKVVAIRAKADRCVTKIDRSTYVARQRDENGDCGLSGCFERYDVGC